MLFYVLPTEPCIVFSKSSGYFSENFSSNFIFNPPWFNAELCFSKLQHSNLGLGKLSITVNFSQLFTHAFRTLFRSSQICCKVRKFTTGFTNRFVNWAFDWLLSLKWPIRGFVYKLACIFHNELLNLTTNLQNSERISEHLGEKLTEITVNCAEIDCKWKLHYW